MDFKNFKKGRKKLQETVNTKMKDQLKPKFAKDERFWMPTKDDSGNADALFRFLPQPDLEAPPIIMYFYHGFKEKGKWFIENCPTTKDNPCPSCEYAEPFWEEDTKESKQIAGKFYRTKQFVSNILVLKDSAKPENNGKVFLYRFGTKIYDKINDKLFPESDLDEPITIMDLWEGANFRLKLRKVSGRNNYDTSSFSDTITPVSKKEENIEKIFKKLYTLDEFLEDDKYKTYDELKKKFNRIMKIKGGASIVKSTKTEGAGTKDDKDLVDDFSDDVTPDTKEDDIEGKVTEDDDFNFEDETTEVKEDEKEVEVKEDEKKSDDSDDFNFDDEDDFNFEE